MVDTASETWFTMGMTTNTATATQNLAEMLANKVTQAIANGATEDQAIAAVRTLWLDYLKEA